MADLVNVAPGQCRIQVDSTSQISLQRYRGSYLPLKISGSWQAKRIAASGPTLANTGLTEKTLYYIYAYDNSGTLTLEASETGHTADTDTGVEIKSGDASRTLVGATFTGSGSPGTFLDSKTERFTRSWFNPEAATIEGSLTANRATSSAIFREIHAEIRCALFIWAGETIYAAGQGVIQNSTAATSGYSSLAIDSIITNALGGVGSTISGVNHIDALAHSGFANASEGTHYLTMFARTDGGASITFFGGASDSATTIKGFVLR